VYTVDRVIAVVDKSPILLSTLRERVLPDLAYMQRQTTNFAERMIKRARIFADTLKRLVDEQLIWEQSREAKIIVSEKDLDQRIAEHARENQQSRKQLEQQYKQVGMSERCYRRMFKIHALESKLLAKQSHDSERIITEQQLRELFQQLRQSEPDQFQSYDESRSVLLDRLRIRRFLAERDFWLKGLRKLTHIEIRLAL